MAIFGDITDSGGTGNINWGHIGGNLSDQADLKNALDGKANIDGSNINENFFNGATLTANTVDYIVESGSNANGYYKKYKSGKTVQGNNITMGTVSGTGSKTYNVVLPTPTNSTNYFASVNLTKTGQSYGDIGYAILNKTTTGFDISCHNNNNTASVSLTFNYIIIEF